MTQRSFLKVQILEKLGAPLLTAAGPVMLADPPQTAQRLSDLLGASVQASLGLSKAMELNDNDPKDDSVKLALVTVCAALIAASYRQSGKVPDDSEIKRLAAGLETVLAYADGFMAVAGRLAGLEADENQLGVQYLNALVPAVAGIAAFPFGRPERKLAQEVAERLAARATGVRLGMAPEADANTAKLMEKGLLRGLAQIYAACHDAEKRRLMATDEAARAGELSMDGVWRAFEQQAGMLEMLGMLAAPAGAAATSGDAVAARPAPLAAPPASVTPPAAPAPVAEPPPVVAAPPPPDGGPYNPMSFFKGPGKKSGDDAASEG